MGRRQPSLNPHLNDPNYKTPDSPPAPPKPDRKVAIIIDHINCKRGL